MGGKWRELRIEDIAEVVGGGTPSTKDEENFNGAIPWVTPKDLSDYSFRYISRGERNISEKGLANSSARLLPQNAVLLTTRAPVGYVAIASNPIATNQGFRSLIVRKGFDHEFVYYLLKANTEYLKSHATGTTFGELSGSTLKRMQFLFPPYAEQRAIAHILGTLDDKIELNRKMNETLEAMARAIFKSWFIDFDPVRAKAEGRDPGLPKEIADLFPDSFENSELGEIPKGWRYLSFEEMVTARQGNYLPSNNILDFPNNEFIFPVWGGNGVRGYTWKKMYNSPVVVLTCRGSNCGLIFKTDSPSWVSNIAFACEPKIGSTNFLYVYLTQSSFSDCISGSAQPQITYNILRKKQLPYPVHFDICKT